MDGTEYSDKACYEKSLSLDPEYAIAWTRIGSVGGGPEGAGGLSLGVSRVVSGVCGEVEEMILLRRGRQEC